MKNLLLLSTILFLSVQTFSQGLWVKKAHRYKSLKTSVTFEINGKGYLYNGETTNNFAMYDPATDTWVAKANFPGVARDNAAGFAIDSLGYVGTGSSMTTVFSLTDFYKYSPATDSWTALGNYPDSLDGAFSFSIGGTGYFAGGEINRLSDIRTARAYNPVSDTWTLIDSLPTGFRSGFSAVEGGIGYCGLGFAGGNNHANLVYAYDPALNTWTSKATYTLTSATLLGNIYSFVAGGKIYAGDPNLMTGKNGAVGVYDIATDSWSNINIYPYQSNCGALTLFTGMTIAGKGYLGGDETCTGTSFWQFDPANYFTLNSLTPDTICEFDSITIDFSSSVAFNPGNKFKVKFLTTNGANRGYSDSVAGTTAGTYTIRVPRIIYNGNNTSSEVSVESTNPVYQTSYSTEKIFVKRAPDEYPMSATYDVCAGSTLLLYRSNSSVVSHAWSSSPAGFSGTNYTLSVTPTQTTTIYVTDTYAPSGCSIQDSTVVYSISLPQLNITDSSFGICPGGTAIIGGTATTNGSYLWSSGGGFSSTVVNPSVSPSATKTYSLQLTDTITGCSSFNNTTVTLIEPIEQTICLVTVDPTSTHNIVVWEKTDKASIDSFYIYREITTNNYQIIGAVHRDSLSEYHDYAANPNSTAYRYKIAVKDTCLNNGTISPYHNTLHIQYTGIGNLNWNVYQIENDTTPVTSFEVFIDDSANGNWDLMLTVPGNQTSATDINYSSHSGALYKVVANFAYSCSPSRSGQNTVSSNITSQSIGTGIATIDLENMVNIYPNPAKNLITINVGKLNIESIGLLNVDGKVVLQNNELKSNTIDISSLAAGFYIVNIKTNEGVVKKQVIKL